MEKLLHRSLYLTFLMLLCGLSWAQNASDPASGNASSLQEVLSSLGETQQLTFLYEERLGNYPTNYRVGDVSNIAAVLKEVLTPLKLVFVKIDEQTYAVKPAAEQVSPSVLNTIDIRGKVTDSADGQPLPGVNVVVKGTSIGSITDAYGDYHLVVEKDAATLIVFSSVGYRAQELPIGLQNQINTTLVPQTTALSEVVVVGYSARARRDMTGAVELIDGKAINSIPAASLGALIGGRMAGVQTLKSSGQPGGSVSVRIRGANSINASAEPLYVVNGVPLTGQEWNETLGFGWIGGGEGQTILSELSFLNPQDVETISVLKDASASAVYGSRGANGVVIITTRRGSPGRTKVRLSSSYGFQQVPKKLPVMNLPQYLSHQQQLEDDGWVDASYYLPQSSVTGAGTQWQDEIFRTAPIQSHHLSLNGGNTRTHYAVSGGYFQQDGIVVGSNFDRYSLSFNLDHHARRWLTVGSSIIASSTRESVILSDAEDGIISQALTTAPLFPVYQSDGNFGGPRAALSQQSNPVALALTRDSETQRHALLGNIYGEISANAYFTWRTELAGDFRQVDNAAAQPTYQWGRTTNDLSEQQEKQNAYRFWMMKNYATYNRTWAKHQVELQGGQEIQAAYWNGSRIIRRGTETDGLTSELPAAVRQQWKGSNALISYFGFLNYNYDNRYWLTASLRADGSSKFGPTHRWGVFPSFAVAWKLHQEKFLQSSALSQLKLRLGYGEVGNQDIEDYAYATPLASTPTQWGFGSSPTRFGNAEVKWESTFQLNAGLDLGLWSNRAHLSVDVYHKRVKDMLVQQPLPLYIGTQAIASPWVNRGELENRGIEVTLSTINISNKSLTWTSSFTFAHNRNRLVSLGGGGIISRNIEWLNAVTRSEVGQPLGQFYGYQVDGLFTSADELLSSPRQAAEIDRETGVWIGDIRFRDIDPALNESGEPVIDERDRSYIGDPNPDFTFGLDNHLTYKNFDVSLLLRGSYGNDVYNYSRVLAEGMRHPGNNQLVTVADRARVKKIYPVGGDDVSNFQLVNPDATLPRAVSSDPNGNTRTSDRYVEDGSYLRLQHFAVGYSWPQARLLRQNIEQLRLFVSAQNLYTFTSYSGFDPEVGAFNNDPLLQGIDNGQYPSPRTVSIGINVTL